MQQKVVKVWIDDTAVHIKTEDGKTYSELFADYPRLRNATPAQRAGFEYYNLGIRWDEIDEDLSYNGFLR